MYRDASRIKLRFTGKSGGKLSVEDLWDLPLQSKNHSSLDGMAISLNQQIRASEATESFVSTTDAVSEELQLKFSIVKDIIKTKLAERDAKANAAKVKSENEVILDIIARKENAELEELPIADLKKRLK